MNWAVESTTRDETAALEARATAAEAEIARLREALSVLLNHYLSLANSGDAGNWDPEKEPEVITARAALEEKPHG